MSYYIVSTNYVGPNGDQFCDSETYTITTEPPRTNMGGEILANGWLGTTNDWSHHAHGEFDSEEEARAAIYELLGDDCREFAPCEANYTPNGAPYMEVACFSVGRYEQADKETSCNWCYYSIKNDVSANTMDEEIEKLLDQYEHDANCSNEPFTLNLDAVRRDMIEHRDRLLSEDAEEGA